MESEYVDISCASVQHLDELRSKISESLRISALDTKLQHQYSKQSQGNLYYFILSPKTIPEDLYKRNLRRKKNTL